MSSGGKGDAYRPTDKKKYDASWERIFGSKRTKLDEEKKKSKTKSLREFKPRVKKEVLSSTKVRGVEDTSHKTGVANSKNEKQLEFTFDYSDGKKDQSIDVHNYGNPNPVEPVI